MLQAGPQRTSVTTRGPGAGRVPANGFFKFKGETHGLIHVLCSFIMKPGIANIY